MIEAVGFRLRELPKCRIDYGLNRTLAQDQRAEGVDGADRGLFQVLQSGLDVGHFGGNGSTGPRDIELLAQAQLQLARRLVGEGYGDDFIDFREAGLENAHDAANKLRRLARSGGGFDDEALGERFANPVARTLVLVPGLGAHGVLRSSTKPSSRGSCCLLRARCSSYGPHTGR